MWGLIIISVSLNLNVCIVPGYSQQPVYVPSNRVFQWNNPYNSSPGQNSWHGQGAHQHHGDHYPAQTPAHFTNSFYAAQTTMMWRTYPSSFQGSLNYGQFIAISTTIFIYMEKWNSYSNQPQRRHIECVLHILWAYYCSIGFRNTLLYILLLSQIQQLLIGQFKIFSFLFDAMSITLYKLTWTKWFNY